MSRSNLCTLSKSDRSGVLVVKEHESKRNGIYSPDAKNVSIVKHQCDIALNSKCRNSPLEHQSIAANTRLLSASVF